MKNNKIIVKVDEKTFRNFNRKCEEAGLTKTAYFEKIANNEVVFVEEDSKQISIKKLNSIPKDSGKFLFEDLPKHSGDSIILNSSKEKMVNVILKKVGGDFIITTEKIKYSKYKITFSGNIKVLYHYRKFDKKINAEAYVYDFFGELGWRVFKSVSVARGKIKGLDYLKPLSKYTKGMPDFIAFKGNRVIFIEVKTGEDGLRSSQIRWITQHPEYEVILFYLKQNGEK